MRLITAATTCACTPVLIGIACVRWMLVLRKNLPHWRNAAGLTSILILSVLWLRLAVTWLVLARDSTFVDFLSSDWREFEIFLPAYYVLAALPLALTLKGTARVMMILAWMCISGHHSVFGYT
jgi:hypothetical protein